MSTIPTARVRTAVPAIVEVRTVIRESGRQAAELTTTHSLNSPINLSGSGPFGEVRVLNEDSVCVNYNTTRVGVSVTVPCNATEDGVNVAYEFASGKVKEFMEQEKRLVGGTFTDHVPPLAAQRLSVPLPPPPRNQLPPPPSGILRANL